MHSTVITSQLYILIIYESSVCSNFDDIISSLCGKINMHRVPLCHLDISDIKAVR